MERHGRSSQSSVLDRSARVLSQTASHPPVAQAVDNAPQRPVALPDRKYFKIGEVAVLVGVEPHVLRYWETQFPQIRPVKARSGHRLYRRREVETLLAIRELLHVQRYTIAGARQALRAGSLLPQVVEVDGFGSPVHREVREVSQARAEVDDADGDSLDPIVDTLDPAADGGVEYTELHLADPIERDTVDIEVVGLDGTELTAAMAAQQAQMEAARRGQGVVELSAEVERVPGRLIRAHTRRAQAILQDAAGELERLLARLS